MEPAVERMKHLIAINYCPLITDYQHMFRNDHTHN